MGSPLSDITVYSFDHKISKLPLNYISDFYHRNLNEYKPPKTSRINLILCEKTIKSSPWYVGSICNYDCVIDYKKYFLLPKEDQYRYILELVHSSILEIANYYNWEECVFIDSYNKVINSHFIFEINYPPKISSNQLNVAQILLSKTETKSTLYAILSNNNEIVKEKLIEKENFFWFDDIYKIAEKAKWINNDSFGISFNYKNIYYSLTQQMVFNKFINDNS